MKRSIGSNMINNLVIKSNQRVPQKQIIVEDIEYDGNNDIEEDEFFQFGKRNKMFQNSLPEMEEIV